jgi:hypothetical protein
MALAKNQKRIPCIDLHKSRSQPMVSYYSMIAARNWYPDKSVYLPNKLIDGEMSKLKLWSDSEIRSNHAWTR